METNKQANVCISGLSFFANLLNTFVCNMEYYYGRSKNNRKTPTGTKNLYYYGRIITMAGITMAGQKYIAEIGNLPGPKICITMDELLLWPVLLWPDCTVYGFCFR